MRASDAAAPGAGMSRADRFSAGWFGAALAFTTATQLRRGPLGPGEAMLLVWLVVRVAGLAVQRTVCVPREARPVLYFWIAAVPLLLAGWLSKVLVAGISRPNSALYDTAAFAFTAGAIVVFILQRDLAARVRAAAAAMFVACVGPLALLLAAGVAGVGTGPVKVWFGFRFAGWSLNPNQAALALLPMPLIALFFFSASRTAWERVRWGAGGAGAVLLGVATLSDGLMLAWAVSFAPLAAVAFFRIASDRRGSILRQGLMRVVVPLLVLLSAGAIAPRVVAKVAEAAGELSASRQSSERLTVWANGLRALGSSPLVGLGPGSHSGEEGPHQGFESHNTYIDWSTSTGLLGLALLAALLGWAGARALRERCAPRLLILASLLVFSIFHYVLRQPSFWFVLLFVAVAGVPAARVATVGAAVPRGGAPRPAVG
jgi:O-antigen ligase